MLVHFLILVFLSHVLAMAPIANVYHRSALGKIIATPEGTLENVIQVFSLGDGCPENDFAGIDLLIFTRDLEVVKYVLGKSVNMDQMKRISHLCDIIVNLFRWNEVTFEISENDLQILIFCFQEFRKHENTLTLMDQIFHQFVLELVINGSTELAEVFVDFGFDIWHAYPLTLNDLQYRKVETMRYLLNKGYSLCDDWAPIQTLMQQEEFTPADFLLCFRSGLPPKINDSYIWFEEALRHGRMDLAVVAYQRGFTLSHEKMPLYSEFKVTPFDFADHLVRKKCIDKVMLILAGATTGDSNLACVPMDIIFSEFGFLLYSLEISAELKLIFGDKS